MEIKLYQLLFQFINFGILLFILTKLLYKPILKILDQRADRIDAGLLAAQKNLEDREQLEAFKKAEITKAETESSQIIEAAKKEAKTVADKIVTEAKQKAESLLAKEEAAFQARLKAEEKRFAQKLADLVALTTKSVLRETLTSSEQQAIIAHGLKQLPKYKVN